MQGTLCKASKTTSPLLINQRPQKVKLCNTMFSSINGLLKNDTFITYQRHHILNFLEQIGNMNFIFYKIWRFCLNVVTDEPLFMFLTQRPYFVI